MARGENTADHPGRKVGRPEPEYEIGRHQISPDAPDRVGFHLTGGGYTPSWQPGHTSQRFGSHEEALSYVEKNRLKLKAPEGGLPPSDAGDVGWAGRKKR